MMTDAQVRAVILLLEERPSAVLLVCETERGTGIVTKCEMAAMLAELLSLRHESRCIAKRTAEQKDL